MRSHVHGSTNGKQFLVENDALRSNFELLSKFTVEGDRIRMLTRWIAEPDEVRFTTSINTHVESSLLKGLGDGDMRITGHGDGVPKHLQVFLLERQDLKLLDVVLELRGNASQEFPS